MNLNIRQLRKSQGFTMAELIIVIAILAVLIVYLVRNFGVRADDAKIAMVSNILSKDVPAAFQAFIMENNGCIDPADNATNIDNILGRSSYEGEASPAIKFLLDNGVPAGTPWQTASAGEDGPQYSADYAVWDATFYPADTDGNPAYLEIEYPLLGVGDTDRAQTVLETKLINSSEIHSINGQTAAGGFDRDDIDDAADTAGFVTLHYACS